MADQSLTLISPNVEQTLLASASRTASPDTFTVSLYPRTRFLWVVTDLTAHGGAVMSLTCTISGYDHLSGKLWTLLTGTTIAAHSTQALTVGVG